jgi:hypothetical protein
MKRKVILIAFLSILILSIVSITYSFSAFRNKAKLQKIINVSKLNNGDLILRCGKSSESYAVHLADNGAEFTHIGIISIEDNIPFVIHAVPHNKKFIKKEAINVFLDESNASQFAIYRTNYSNLKEVVKEAQSFYQKKYEFDTKYNLESDSKLYCTELIQKAFKNAGISLKLKTKEFDYGIGKHKIIFPSEFTKAPIFKRIL